MKNLMNLKKTIFDDFRWRIFVIISGKMNVFPLKYTSNHSMDLVQYAIYEQLEEEFG